MHISSHLIFLGGQLWAGYQTISFIWNITTEIIVFLPKMEISDFFLWVTEVEKCSYHWHIFWRSNFGHEEEKPQKKSTQIHIGLQVSKIAVATCGLFYISILLETFLPSQFCLVHEGQLKKKKEDSVVTEQMDGASPCRRPATSAPQTAPNLSTHSVNLHLQP